MPFTAYGYGAEDIEWQPDHMKYLLYGRETCPTTGKEHLQGYVQFKKKQTIAGAKKIFGDNTIHFEFAKGDYEENYKYCTKTRECDEVPNVFFERGEPTRKKGQRNDLQEVLRRIEAGNDLRDLMFDHEVCDTVARCMPFVRQACADFKANKGLNAIKSRMANVQLRSWQLGLLSVVNGEPDNRSVYWFWDAKGNTGKSFMVDYLLANKGAIVFTHGKMHDIAHAYNYQKVVCFDLARTQEEKLDAVYMALECFKNGRMFSGKYESTTKTFEIPHVIVFANFAPDKTKLSEDRWKITQIVTV
jgi:hypothetical protein